MRKVIVSSYATLDGKVDSLQEWVTPYNDDAVAAYHEALLADSDGLLLGRTTYQVFATIWPPRKGALPYAHKINAMAKHVASSTLGQDDLTWENSHPIDGDVAAGVAELKQRDGGDLVVYGGPGLVDTLVEHDLVDEFRIMVSPVLFRKGRPLLKDGGPRVDLELLDATVITAGAVLLTYRTKR